ncbi:hypothetical protein [Deinococcus aetherius]|nr:hypothetical protein [Deinococcus aetherius]
MYLLRPGQVTSRTEGDTAEQYVNPSNLAERLRELDTEWTAQRLPPEATATDEAFDSRIEWGGW